MKYEEIRKVYKPDKVKLLFVGESRPQQGTFFYLQNSNLFNYTKQAFEDINTNFTLDKFKELGCWVYDVCDCPVNNVAKNERIKAIQKGLPSLIDTIKELAPNFIIVVKRGYFGNMVINKIFEIKNYNVRNTFNLPFPACGHQLKYKDELARIIKILFTNKAI